MKPDDPFKFLNPLGNLPSVLDGLGTDAHKGFGKSIAVIRGSAPDKSYAGVSQFIADHYIDELERFRTNLDDSVIVSAIRDIMSLSVGSLWWQDLGFPTIQLTHDFQRAVAVTDLGDAGDEPVRLPFPAFVLRLPEALDGTEKATSLFVYPVQTQMDDGSIGFGFTRMSHPSTNEEHTNGGFTQWPTDFTTFDTLINSKSTLFEEQDPDEAAASLLLGTKQDRNAAARARRILGNTLLYINSHGGLPATKTLGPDVPVEREHATQPRFRVGRPVKLGKAFRNAFRDRQDGGSTWKLAVRYIVRGHWRNQAHGPGRALRRRQWIQPFFKGPADLTDALERLYVVD